jgi:uncharacterized peroxidase-related enzyme
LHDLRSEIASDLGLSDSDGEALVDRFAADWRTAGLDAQTHGLLDFSAKLTATPAAMGRGDIDALRALGWDDRAVHDTTQVCAYFNYINRIADALGVHPEDWMDLAGHPLRG